MLLIWNIFIQIYPSKVCFDTHLFVAKFEINQMINKKDMSLKPPQNVRSVTLFV